MQESPQADSGLGSLKELEAPTSERLQPHGGAVLDRGDALG